jgi:diguanylate cyclase (GGDEF)-like protein/PAS domain S-box-containing protein
MDNILSQKTKEILNNLFDGIYVVDRSRRIVYWNPSAERITGYQVNEVFGRICSDNILNHIDETGKCLCDGLCPLARSMEDGCLRDTEIFMHHKSGHRMPVRVRTVPLRDGTGTIVGSIEIFRESRSQEALQDRLVELEKLALLDALTQLPNRRYATARLDAGLSQFRRTGQPMGILFIDIDHFKHFNDTHGHATGDQALQTLGQTFSHTIRPHDTIARWGGEEFIGIFPNTDCETLRMVAHRLCTLVRATRVEIPNASLGITVSVGGTISKPEDTSESLIDRADSMMYHGKQAGRNRFIIEL